MRQRQQEEKFKEAPPAWTPSTTTETVDKTPLAQLFVTLALNALTSEYESRIVYVPPVPRDRQILNHIVMYFKASIAKLSAAPATLGEPADTSTADTGATVTTAAADVGQSLPNLTTIV